MTTPSRFAFVDEGEAVRILGVDRDALLTFVREKRLRAYKSGIVNYYRTQDLDALLAELRVEAESEHDQPEQPSAAGGRKVFDPAYKVHVRLQADLKWYDLEDDDLRAWVREMTSDGYARQRMNINMIIGKLQRMTQLMDEAAAGWENLKPERVLPPTVSPTPSAPTPSAPTTDASAPPKKPRRQLPMVNLSPPEKPG
jgi:hypothetical protein